MHRLLKGCGVLVMGGGLLVVSSGCRKAQGPPPMGPPVVSVVTPVPQEVVDWDESIGRLEAVESVEIRARASGYLREVAFRPGDIVKKGQLLFVIDERPYQAALAEAEANLARAQAAQKMAAIALERARTLRQQNVSSMEELDEKTSASLQADAGVRAAQAAVDTARLNLSYCRITSPISGKVGKERFTVGNLIEPEMGTAQVLTTVVGTDPIYATADIDERTLLRYQKLQREGKFDADPNRAAPVFLGLQNESGYPHQGRVDFIDNRVDPATGTIRVRSVFPNKDGVLMPGLFARLRSPGAGTYTGLVVPEKALGTDQARRFVLVVNPAGELEYRPVEPGPLLEGGLRAIRSGLAPTDQVVTGGAQMLHPGVRVQTKPDAMPAPSPVPAGHH